MGRISNIPIQPILLSIYTISSIPPCSPTCIQDFKLSSFFWLQYRHICHYCYRASQCKPVSNIGNISVLASLQQPPGCLRAEGHPDSRERHLWLSECQPAAGAGGDEALSPDHLLSQLAAPQCSRLQLCPPGGLCLPPHQSGQTHHRH